VGSYYAIVHDVPASWADYPPGLESLDQSLPDGLLVRVAGPTEEGFRLIEVWQSEHDWTRFRDGELPGLLQTDHITTRELSVAHLWVKEGGDRVP
jgi:hypothetical protein